MSCLKWFSAVLLSLLAMAGIASAAETMRLEWVIQGQFAGPLLALEKGYYKEAGVEMQLLPAGPDLKPAVTVAQGTDSFGIGHPNQVIAARANGAPLVTVLQLGHRSASVYVVRKAAGINSIKDMKGRSVGLWFGGDEHEFLAMLKAAGIDQNDVKIVNQGFDIIAWLNGDYEVMQATIYNELQQVYAQGIKKEDLVLLDPRDSGVAMVNTGIFTTEQIIKERPDAVQAVVNATLRGWKEALANPEEAARIVVKHNSELKVEDQVKQINAMGELFCSGATLEGKFGQSVMAEWETVQKVLLDAKLISEGIDLSKAFTNAFWEKVPAEYKTINCPAS
jgi:NitT/TauT family transport system substrate-binding protein